MIREFTGEWRFLSNFHPARVWLDGMRYASVEHAYQAAKTHDVDARRYIQEAATAAEAKKRGKLLAVRPAWAVTKITTMQNLIRQKFALGTTEAALLLSTGALELQEGNRWGDDYWGVDLKTGLGSNVLGQLLMEQRRDLCAGTARAYDQGVPI